MPTSRRRFLGQATVGGLLALGDAPLVPGLSRVAASEAEVSPNIVQFQPEIEPLVRLLEDTPRERLLEEVAHRIRNGLSYREVLAALLLAGVRNVQPRPSVGFKFHAVLVVNSAHLASLSSPDQDRWLPIFWALDYFKSSQARDVKEGNWTMAPVAESAVPTGSRAKQQLHNALQAWDEEAADAAVVGVVRSSSMHDAFEILARYGARDFRSIGHKAIYVANAFRTLQCIGWRYAEPVLRSLTYALMNHEGQPNPAKNDLEPDRPWRRNKQLAETLRADWTVGKADDGATQSLLVSLRTDDPAEVCNQVTEMVNRGVAVQSIYDAIFLSAGELLMRQPGIVALHASTTTNAMRYAFATASNDSTRRLLLLQNAAFLPLFRDAMNSRGEVGDATIDTLQPVDDASQATPEEAFAILGHDRFQASQQMLRLLGETGSPSDLIRIARQLVFLKGTDSHDYKFSSAVLEDYYQVSPNWRNRFFAASCHKLRSSADGDNGLVERIRAAFA